MEEEEELYTESFESMLNALVSMVQSMDEEDQNKLASPCAVPIVESFIHCHLSAPDGMRKQAGEGKECSGIRRS